MWPYWLMFAIPLLATTGQIQSGNQKAAWYSVIIVFALLIGLRFEVGGDWGSYLRHFNEMRYYDFGRVLERGDPGYYLLNWIVFGAGGSVVWVNFLCAIVVMIGVSRFASNQPLPWLALLVAVPYLLIVVSMGYTRQSAALGFALLGLTALAKQQTRQFVLWVVLGALFHKSAVLLLPIAALSATKNKVWTLVWVGVSALGAAYFLVLDTAETLYTNYVLADYAYASQGGQIRVMMNAVPAVLLLVFRNRLFYNVAEQKLWVWIAMFSLACIPLLSYSATAVDRVALYFIPIQMFVFSRLPLLMKGRDAINSAALGVVAYYGAVQFVWLNFAHHAFAWLPYKNALFQ